MTYSCFVTIVAPELVVIDSHHASSASASPKKRDGCASLGSVADVDSPQCASLGQPAAKRDELRRLFGPLAVLWEQHRDSRERLTEAGWQRILLMKLTYRRLWLRLGCHALWRWCRGTDGRE
eukprot:CAMPEP_0181195258 /NCGR_PEP_ID=MMETSP1096-20121128/14784_1 /TAXON_ID=156174 ORGANISM="Chrysochromulina ericina, Strain CCMP281" /NCGR_SAMPLE_ID=MMETSP1096 /ASSEMBLY_ACC=CAM_ASM_000453 /LENGTH=121 /DNA_ID=CAMNT_0023284835 /DNA_START=1604 /DNA_END=1971 /DNA_ORIENTATION=-